MYKSNQSVTKIVIYPAVPTVDSTQMKGLRKDIYHGKDA